MANVSGGSPPKIARDKSDDLRRLLQLCGADPGSPPTLAQLQKEARAYGLRRADQAGGRDNLIYRLGYALDAIGWLSVHSHELIGVLSSTDLLSQIIVKHLQDEGTLPLIELIRVALERPDIATWARAEGQRLEWQRLRALYEKETAEFKASAGFLKTDWRRRAPTKSQLYLIARIVALTDVPRPEVKSRGAAFDFIDQAGGNPRFFEAPANVEPPQFWP